MFTRFLKVTTAAVLALMAVSAAAQAGTVYVIQASSPTYWSANGTRASLYLRYSANATVALNINSVTLTDLGVGNQPYQVQHCGTPTSSGYQLAPGGYCWVDISRSPYEIVGRVLLSDTTGSAANINQYVQASLEITDDGSNVDSVT